MSLIDCLIVVIPVLFVLYMGWYVRRYIVGVSDFLVCGRVCHRYVITTARMANVVGLVTLAAIVEMNYQTGFALNFWNGLLLPLTMLLSLYGFGIYRFRETRALSIGQFIEMRYSRPLRVFSCFVRSIAEMAANIIMPAIAARFFITYLGLPQTLRLLGCEIPAFMVVVFITLTMAIALICIGGELSIVVTDTIQGLLFFPLLSVFIIFVLWKFSWAGEVLPVLSDRVAGESFINPYDISQLRDFNIFMVIVSICELLMHSISGLTGSSNSAASAHEAKMGSILGSWRVAFVAIFYVCIAICLLTVLNHEHFADDAKIIRTSVSQTIAQELLPEKESQEHFMAKIEAIAPQHHHIGHDSPLSRKQNLDTVYFDTAQSYFGLDGQGSSKSQQYITMFRQLLLPTTMRHILPKGLVGLFCLVILLFIISTDDSRIYSASGTLVQDCIVPFCKQSFLTPERHICLIRWISIGVGVLFFFGSYYMAQLDYIQMFVKITYGMWLGGCGPMLTLGMYCRFGTTWGAWCSLLTGMAINLGGILLQRNWAATVYPFLESRGLVDGIGRMLHTLSAPLNPYIVWEMNRLKFPINSYEIYFIAMGVSLIVYCIVSWLTCRTPYNLEQMLHRGVYAVEAQAPAATKMTWKGLWKKIAGITPEHTRGDRIISWSVVLYTIGYKFIGTFVLVVLWNCFSPWKMEWWGHYFLLTSLLVPGVISIVTTVWFSIGSIRDLRRLFRDLEHRIANPLDNGMVEGNISISDKTTGTVK